MGVTPPKANEGPTERICVPLKMSRQRKSSRHHSRVPELPLVDPNRKPLISLMDEVSNFDSSTQQDEERFLFFPGKDSANEKLWSLYTIALPTSFSPP